ncbi:MULTISPECIES: FAD:protein FMN transferase [Ralstonia]|jgi:thiamine biosynthesis lipoprotein|uniref:FAD:protein FMN transferase n=2 Tax=Pseudomonadota TaxID=1224 RepID=R0EDC5_RALPI|nr:MULTISPECIES: FAD:protein FMN transferase [Ralstonia]MEA3271174.1 FAD:protein FMN transferase [Pseudomonadota bacterium]ENZ79342.1 membrane-associated lipoprotein involved in thiamine biosynthesis [Ralstonia pickettii OR214]MBL4780466.1 FAD:protein FMN transferase [Ralstonia sp.]MCM3580391.1 FAD:protein FMN transferase [Ralstonia pickettii]MDR9385433.1 FAD:protein FMN transferase [Ralstonia sp. 11b]
MHPLPPSNLGRRRCLAGVPLLAVGMFVRPALADPTVERASTQLLGTQIDIIAQDARPGAAGAAMRAAFVEMARLECLMSRYRPDSQVSALARAAGRNPVPVAPEVMSVFKLARQVSEQSRGAFDITVGAYSGWNFDPEHSRIPSSSELARERRFVNYRDVVLDEHNGSVYLRRPGMRLDLGGIAKLPILEAGMRVLRQHGIRDAMINGGGDVVASGKLQGHEWRVGLRDPLAPERLLGVVTLSDGVVASSGDYERYFMLNGQRFHHVLDPETGLPAHGPHGVTLIGRDVDDVNGLGAAIMAAGTATGQRMLAPMLARVDALIVGSGARPWMSAGMATRLRQFSASS